MLVLFHDKKCCNCINLFPCTLWDFILLDLVLSWWRIKHAMKISAILRLARKKFVSKGSHVKATWEAHAKSWRVKCQVHFASTFRDRPSREVPTKHSTWRILSVTFLPFTHTIYTLITRKSKIGYSKKTLERFLQHTHLLERELLIL